MPDGLSPSEYAAINNKKKSQAQQNKSRFPKGAPQMVDVADWLVQMEKRQTFLGDKKVDTTGHTFAKEKFASKEEFDAAKGRGKVGNAKAPAAKKPAFKLW